MFSFDKAALEKASAETGFVRDNLEKVYRLMDVLEFINNNPFLKDKLVLKGGTAINLTVFDLPRLSVDIDLDYCNNCSKDEMLADRKEIEMLLVRYMNASGYKVDSDRGKDSHALTSWAFSYINAGGNNDNIKIEINYAMRAHILPFVSKNIDFDFLEKKIDIVSLAPQELFGSKIKALLERTAARDLYDVHNMLSGKVFDSEELEMLRKCVSFYRTVGSTGEYIERIDFGVIDKLTQSKVRQTLLPVLKRGTFVDISVMKSEVKQFLESLMKLTDQEQMYIDDFNKGKYSPELLFNDVRVIERINNHPMALWKCGRAL